jgi:hypothetical protein
MIVLSLFFPILFVLFMIVLFLLFPILLSNLICTYRLIELFSLVSCFQKIFLDIVLLMLKPVPIMYLNIY